MKQRDHDKQSKTYNVILREKKKRVGRDTATAEAN